MCTSISFELSPGRAPHEQRRKNDAVRSSSGPSACIWCLPSPLRSLPGPSASCLARSAAVVIVDAIPVWVIRVVSPGRRPMHCGGSLARPPHCALARRLFARLSRLGLARSLLAATLWARSFLATGLWSEGSGLAARVRWELVRSHRWYEGSNSSKGASQRGAAKSLVVSGSSLRCKGSNNPEGASRCDAAGAPPPRLGRSSSRPLSEIRRDHPMFPMSTRHFPMSTRHFIV